MASGKACLEYKAFLSHSDTLADILDTNQKALTKLHRKLRAKAWIEPAAELSTDQLVALVLKKIETDGKHIFEEFVDFMSDTAGLQDLATRMRDAAKPPKPKSDSGGKGVDDEDSLDLFKIKQEVLPIAPRWKAFGLALGLHSDTLERIDGDHRKVDQCLQALLGEWVSSVNTLRGPPSWELLVSAVASPAGGNHQALAQEIAKKHNVSFPERR